MFYYVIIKKNVGAGMISDIINETGKTAEKRMDLETEDFYNYMKTLSLQEYALKLVDVIKNGKTDINKNTKAVIQPVQLFKDYVFYIQKNKEDYRFGPQLLYYPCKPNAEECKANDDYQELLKKCSTQAEKNLLEEDLPSLVLAYQRHKEVQAAFIECKRALDPRPYLLTERLKATKLPYSTILDCLFANANFSQNFADCLDAFLELYKTEPKFNQCLSDNLLSQAMAQANPETRKYIIRNCPEFYQYLPAQIFKDRPFELFDNRVFRVNNLEYQKIALEAVPIQDKAELEEIIETKNTEAKQELTNSSAHTK